MTFPFAVGDGCRFQSLSFSRVFRSLVINAAINIHQPRRDHALVRVGKVWCRFLFGFEFVMLSWFMLIEGNVTCFYLSR